MARFSEIRKHAKGAKRRAAKEDAQTSRVARPASQAPSVGNVVKVAVKPTVQRARGRHLRSYELDPFTCDPRDLVSFADDEIDLDGLSVSDDEVAA